MSYFGKKTLVYWDYHNHEDENAQRFNNTNSNLQLEILKKWYPLLTVGNIIIKSLSNVNSISTAKYVVKGYEIEDDKYSLKISRIINNDPSDIPLSLQVGHLDKLANPVLFVLDKEFENRIVREHKLNRLFSNKK